MFKPGTRLTIYPRYHMLSVKSHVHTSLAEIPLPYSELVPLSIRPTPTMPVHIVAKGWYEGIEAFPYGWTIVKVTPVLGLLYLLKWYFNGATNVSERNMHSKVVMMTVNLMFNMIGNKLTCE
jgi:hypothetical protein